MPKRIKKKCGEFMNYRLALFQVPAALLLILGIRFPYYISDNVRIIYIVSSLSLAVLAFIYTDASKPAKENDSKWTIIFFGTAIFFLVISAILSKFAQSVCLSRNTYTPSSCEINLLHNLAEGEHLPYLLDQLLMFPLEYYSVHMHDFGAMPVLAGIMLLVFVGHQLFQMFNTKAKEMINQEMQTDSTTKLIQLKKMLDEKVITEEEFQDAKKRLFSTL
jgi:hypothetical protein